MGKKKDSVSSLGRHLIRQKQKDLSKHLVKTERHVLDLDDSQNVRSITETTTLEDFLSTAQMANKEFTAERENIKIIDPNRRPDEKDVEEVTKCQQLMIPRRPKWVGSTTAEELNQLEYEAYLEWRRHLEVVSQTDGIVLTPFEKNIEFWRQLWRVVERSDVCIQILDARNPLIFICEDLQKYVKELDENKINVILLNKSDFLTETQRQIWAKYFDDIRIKALFFSAKQELENNEDKDQLSSVEVMEDNDWIHNSSQLLNRYQLINIFKSFRSNRSSDSITIGLVGYPNVGKSSTINAILQSKRVSVSATPGKTKHFQTLVVDNELTLCDCPGLIFPNVVSSKAEMIVNGILPIDQLKDAIPPTAIITARIPRHVFESLYSIILPKPTEFEDPNRSVTAEELLTTYGYSRGFMTQRGIPDNSRSGRHILKDFVCGKLLYSYCPPNCDQKLFHKFPENCNQKNDLICEPLKRILESSQITQKDFDKTYFMSSSTGAHIKGIEKIPTRMAPNSVQCNDTDTCSSNTSKPWKKHNNRKKREKLRRIYSHLDQ